EPLVHAGLDAPRTFGREVRVAAKKWRRAERLQDGRFFDPKACRGADTRVADRRRPAAGVVRDDDDRSARDGGVAEAVVVLEPAAGRHDHASPLRLMLNGDA